MLLDALIVLALVVVMTAVVLFMLGLFWAVAKLDGQQPAIRGNSLVIATCLELAVAFGLAGLLAWQLVSISLAFVGLAAAAWALRRPLPA